MRADVERGLTATYGADQFKIADLKRRGSAADSTAPAGETRRVVYYDVELRLDRDVTLGAWDKPGAASLVTLLGAGPRSISGVKSSGNQAGDRIIAHASAIYRKDGDAWTLVTPAGFKAAEAPTLDSGTPPPSRASCWTRWTRSRTRWPTAPPAPRNMSCSRSWNARCHASTAA